jgi:hypothetical protein
MMLSSVIFIQRFQQRFLKKIPNGPSSTLFKSFKSFQRPFWAPSAGKLHTADTVPMLSSVCPASTLLIFWPRRTGRRPQKHITHCSDMQLMHRIDMDRHIIVILWIYWEHSLNKHTDLHRSMWQHVTNQSMNKSVRKRSKVSHFADLKWNEGSFLWASSAAKKMPLTAMEQSEIVWREAKFQFWRCLDICSSIWSCFRSYFRSCLEFENLPELGSFTTVSDLFSTWFLMFLWVLLRNAPALEPELPAQAPSLGYLPGFAELPKSHQLAWQKQKSEEFCTQPHRAQDKQMERVTRRCFMTDKLPMNWCELNVRHCL